MGHSCRAPRGLIDHLLCLLLVSSPQATPNTTARFASVEAEGVADVNVIGVCTKETEYLPSHRRSPDGRRFAAIVAIR